MDRRNFLISLGCGLAFSPLSLRGQDSGPAAPLVLGVIEYGQSNSEGQAREGAACLRVDYPGHGRLRMPQSAAANVWMGLATVGGRSIDLGPNAVTGLMPLRGAMGSATHGSTAGESMVLRHFERAQADAGQRPLHSGPNGEAKGEPEIVLFNVAEGGQRIVNLLSSADDKYFGFRNLKRVVEVVDRTLRAEHKRYVVRVILTAQGESDEGNARLGELQERARADIESTVRAITGQADPVWMLSVQPSSFAGNSTGARAILDQHLASLGQGGAYFCLGPTYNFPFASDYLHHTSEGHDMRGELYAVAYESLLQTGRWDVLRATRARVLDTQRIEVELSEAVVFDSAAPIAPQAHGGIRLAGGEIASAQADGKRLLIRTHGPAAAVSAVRIGLDGHPGKERSAATVPRTQFRSAAEYGRYRNGAPIHKWLCHQEVALPAAA